MKTKLAFMLVLAFGLGANSFAAAEKKSDIKCPSEDPRCWNAIPSGRCQAMGTTTIYENDDATVVKKKDAIFVLSSKATSCRSFKDEAEWKKAGSISRAEGELHDLAMGCFNGPGSVAVESCDKVLNDFGMDDECRRNPRCNGCLKIIDEMRAKVNQHKGGTAPPAQPGSGTGAYNPAL